MDKEFVLGDKRTANSVRTKTSSIPNRLHAFYIRTNTARIFTKSRNESVTPSVDLFPPSIIITTKIIIIVVVIIIISVR